MPKGPRGEKRPADAIGRAIHIAKIATGEVEDDREELSSAAAQLGSKGGKKRDGGIGRVDFPDRERGPKNRREAFMHQINTVIRRAPWEVEPYLLALGLSSKGLCRVRDVARAGALFRVLQLHSHSQDAAHVACYGRWNHGSALVA